VKLERERIVEIEHRATRFKSILGDDFVRKAISDGKTADQFSVEAFAALSAKVSKPRAVKTGLFAVS